MSDQTTKPGGNPPDTLRRTLVKGGLAAPVVLASLASKPVLAVSWNCTISGQLSGNTSSHGEACDKVGTDASTLASNTYPYPTSNAMSTVSALFPGVADYFFISGTTTDSGGGVSGGTLWFSSDGSTPSGCSGCSAATINQILHLSQPSGSEYAIKALVLLLNAKGITDASIYPLIQSQAERMYVAAATGGGFHDTNPTVDWDNAQVHTFIDLIYRANP